jgi:hypothetical protein
MSALESHIPNKQRLGALLLRVFLGAVALVAVPPFVLLALVPMLLMLAPVALVAIPFMVCAFAGEASEARASSQRSRAPLHSNGRAMLISATYPLLVRSSSTARQIDSQKELTS